MDKRIVAFVVADYNYHCPAGNGTNGDDSDKLSAAIEIHRSVCKALKLQSRLDCVNREIDLLSFES